MKRYPLLTIIIITTILVTIPGLFLNTGLIKTSESDNYSLKKTAASSTIHELKLLTQRTFSLLTHKDRGLSLEESVPYNIPGLSADKPPIPPVVTAEVKPAEENTEADAEEKEPEEETGAEGSDGTEEQTEEPAEEQSDAGGIYNNDPDNPNFQTVDDSYFLDACFIGDSRTKGFGMYSGLTTTIYAKVGLQLYKVFEDRVVDTVYGKLTVPEALASGVQFKKVYLMFGLNEMGWGNDEMFMQYYYYLIDMVKATQPQAVIYVQQIIHVTKNKAASSPVFANDKIDHRNELLRKVAADEHVYYLELNEVFTDEEGNLPADYSFDGVHFAAGSMKIWKDYLETHAIVPDPSYATSTGPVMAGQPENPEAGQEGAPEGTDAAPAEGTEQAPADPGAAEQAPAPEQAPLPGQPEQTP